MMYEDSYVYLMGTTEKGVYKIGESSAPKNRLHSLKHCKFIVTMIPNGHVGETTLERQLHRMVKSERTNPEWGREYFRFNEVSYYYIIRFYEYMTFRAGYIDARKTYEYDSYSFYAAQRYAHETTMFMFGEAPLFSDTSKISQQRYNYHIAPPVFAMNKDFVSWKESQGRI